MSVPRQLRLYGWTLANMRPKQLLGVVKRAGRNHLLPRLPVDIDERYEAPPPSADALNTEPLAATLSSFSTGLTDERVTEYRRRARDAAAGQIELLNETVDVSGDPIDWNPLALEELPRLWRLKLHGFEPIYWLVTSTNPADPDAREWAATFETWVGDWLDRYPVGDTAYLRRAWTPYAVSKRVVNLALFCAWQATGGQIPGRPIRAALQKNADFLIRNVEHDVGGNHVVENGVALTMAGSVLPQGAKYWDAGLSTLVNAAEEQFLPDGGHYERSPMYHAQVLWGYLTVLDLCLRTGRPCPDTIADTARRGMKFLATLEPPDGRIPLLNDAVFGEGPSLDTLRSYASRIDGTGWEYGAPSSSEPQSALPDAGYYWLGRSERDGLLIDGGPVGPAHLPGHSHNDILSVLLWVDRQRVVADTGTFSYKPGDRRQYARGVAGHSTVQVGDREPIELGRRFLMGERSAPETAFQPGPIDAFRGKYTAHCGYSHTRSAYGGKNWWFVWDRVSGAETEPLRSRLMLHPDVSVTGIDSAPVAVTGPDGEPLLWVSPLRTDRITRTDGEYFPRFGKARLRDVLELHPAERAEAFGYVLSTTPPGNVEVTTEGAEPVELSIGSTTLEVPTV
jgi:uncharacterized heparinase superfamily protein